MFGRVAIDAACFSVPLNLTAGTVGDYAVRQLQHDGSHHLIVLVVENVAVIDKAGVLSQLVGGHVEVIRLVPCLVVI
jgi:hypothetical protein